VTTEYTIFEHQIIQFLNKHGTAKLWNFIDNIIENLARIQYEMEINAGNLTVEIAEAHFKNEELLKIKDRKLIYNENLNKKFQSKKYSGSILKIAEDYGLKIRGNKARCPFHADTDPSLKFYPNTNSFYCFGCQEGGDIITFIGLMEELNEKNKR